MMPLERPSLASASAKAEPDALLKRHLAQLCEAAEGRRNVPCQYPIHARSGRAADAVRGHSFSLAPTRSGSVSLERPLLPFFVSLTPARWDAMRLAVADPGLSWVGGAVLTEPSQNLCQNRQLTEIVGQSCAVPWFRAGASRHAREGVCVSPCAYMCARKARTSEPVIIIYVNQVDRGSKVGSVRFSPEPALRGRSAGDGIPPISNILVGRYAAAALDRGRRGLMRSRAGETFGVFGSAGRVGRAGCSSSTRRARIDGKAWVFGGAQRVVGTPLLERGAESLGFTPLSASPHLPSGKAAARALGGRGTPPCPLSRSQPPHWRWRSSVAELGSASARSIRGEVLGAEKSARSRFRRTGSGEALRAGLNPADEPGRGYSDAADLLRRTPCMGGGVNRVK